MMQMCDGAVGENLSQFVALIRRSVGTLDCPDHDRQKAGGIVVLDCGASQLVDPLRRHFSRSTVAFLRMNLCQGRSSPHQKKAMAITVWIGGNRALELR